MIKFIVDRSKEAIGPVFGEVLPSQFFIDSVGLLCQKFENNVYTVIAESDGSPCSMICRANLDTPIRKILPKVEKIIFQENS